MHLGRLGSLKSMLMSGGNAVVEMAKYIAEAGKVDKSLLVFSGPSGAGKSTLLKQLFEDFPGTFGFSVSHTTRKPRPGEVDGVDYNFVSQEQFNSLLDTPKTFLEHANFSGNSYGTTFKAIKDVQTTGKVCVLDVDLAGVKSIKSFSIEMRARFIFVAPPSKEELEKRLRKRGTESEESLKRRLSRVDSDLEYARIPGNYDLVLVNGEFEETYTKLVEFIFNLDDQ